MKNKISFMNTLFQLTSSKNELMAFLVENKLMTEAQVQAIMLDAHNLHAGQIVAVLEKLKKEDKLQLLCYEWSILPIEVLTLSVVTNSDKFIISTNR